MEHKEIHMWTGALADWMEPGQGKFVLCLSEQQKPDLLSIMSTHMGFDTREEKITCRQCLVRMKVDLVTEVGGGLRVVVKIQDEDPINVYLSMDYGDDQSARTFRIPNEAAVQISQHLYDRARIWRG